MKSVNFTRGSFVLVPNKEVLKGKKSYVQSVYLWLADHTDDNLECYPSRKLIAHEAGCNIKSVDLAIKELILLGILTKFQRRNEDNPKELSSNMYVLKIKEIAPKVVHTTPENGITSSSKNGSVTIPIINSTQLTKVLKKNKQRYINQLQRSFDRYNIDDDANTQFEMIINLASDYQNGSKYLQVLNMYGICIPTKELTSLGIK